MRNGILVGAVAVVLSGTAVHAGTITWIGGVTASASANEGSTRLPANLVNNSGMYYTTTDNPAAHNNDGNNIEWNTGGITRSSTWVKFDLGSAKAIGQMWVWNNDCYAGYSSRGFKTADIWYAATTPTVTNPTDATPGNWTKLSNDYSFNKGTTTGQWSEPLYYYLEANDKNKVTMNVSAQYVLMNDVYSWGWTSGNNDHIGLSEVKFTAGVPEPSTMSLVGMATLGGLAMLRRRRMFRK